ncbi:hypothetical protein RB200_34245 [Streptomyces sp. PmtG]
MPAEILNCDDVSRWVRPLGADGPLDPSRTTPFALLLVLDSGVGDRRRSLAERVSVTRGADTGVVTLRFPSAPPAPARVRTATESWADQVRDAVAAFCVTASKPGPWRTQRILTSLGAGSMPRGMTDPQLLSLRPDLTRLRPSPPHTAGQGQVPATLEIAGLLPTERLASEPEVTVLYQSEQDVYAFVAVEIPVVLTFMWGSSGLPLDVTLRHVAQGT